MFKKIRDLDPVIHFLLFLCIVVLAVGVVYLFTEIRKVKTNVSETPKVIAAKRIGCDEECKNEIKRAITDAISKIVAVPKTIVQKSTTAEKRISYIPLVGPASTTSNEWIDAKSTDLLIDLKNEYSEEAYVDWEASVKVNSSSGKVFVRLFDVTHGIAVNGSELFSNSLTSTRVSSERLYLWLGHNLYRVQVRAFAPSEATFESGRIKIVY